MGSIFSSFAQSIDPSSIHGKVICGYQAWFNCPGDGSPIDRWFAWAYPSPAPGNVDIELYPEVSEYRPEDLFYNNFGNLGDGTPATFFSSYSESVTQLHFSWMEENGIDGVALQRFITQFDEPILTANRDSNAVRVARAAEEYGRVFYMMYDITELGADLFTTVTEDWEERMIKDLQITSSPQYLHQDGKPVICIWGIGFDHVYGTSEETAQLIEWFKNQGIYVIGGVPIEWRTGEIGSKPNFDTVYTKLDMVSPWTVGGFFDTVAADSYNDHYLEGDFAYCEANGLDYLPVMFAGISNHNWEVGASPQNQVPRLGGDFFWHQVKNIRNLGISSGYIAMFDEYNESTAIMNSADSYFSIPSNQYFLTLSADGVYHSPDFYLRLAGEISQHFRDGTIPPPTFTTSPHSAPFFFRTSMEPKYDAQPDWLNTFDEGIPPVNVAGPNGTGFPNLSLVNDQGHLGTTSLLIEGVDQSNQLSLVYFQVFDVDVTVEADTDLSYHIMPLNEGGRNVAIDLIMSDGSNLRDTDAVDQSGNGMHPGNPRGTIDEWTEIRSPIGQWISGKTIDRIVITYDYGPEERPFAAYVDDVRIENNLEVVTSVEEPIQSQQDFKIYPNPTNTGFLHFELSPTFKPSTCFIYNRLGQLVSSQNIQSYKGSISINHLKSDLYFIQLSDGQHTLSRKFIRL
ncbi:hypothetical protein GCM10007940_34260 [Portibacter lacus]|uniref:Secretion system C-terminal sorting domain-containing protein n=1 Tax=Portibacter lacus TaxID=1099794 RepID=A0AA37WHH5_9BACT|nr:hypothetical protein GCM10007940_34260 [Portibacter lacus]